MLSLKSPWLSQLPVIVTLVMLVVLGAPAHSQNAARVQVGPHQIKGIPDDWTHHHVIFSNPGTQRDAIWQGRLQQWQKIVNDPRYVVDQLKRHALTQGPSLSHVSGINQTSNLRSILGESGLTNRFGDGNGGRFRNGNGGIFGRGLGKNTPKIKTDWSMDVGFNGALEPGQYPAKFSFLTNSSACGGAASPDFVVYNTNQPGSNVPALQANIIAYDNIYSGCSGTVPSVYWSYYTGTGSSATSPVISLDGSKVAFIEDENPAGSATLQILQWKAGQGTDYNGPAAPDHVFTNTTAGAGGNTAWSSCPAGSSCLISVAIQVDPNNDVKSAPYYDYLTDTLWVGDAFGFVHEFTGVFNGTPGEVTTGGWPADEGCRGPLASPVYDETHSRIFIEDFCGHLSSFTTAGVETVSGVIGGGPADMSDAPLVDPDAGMLYVIVSEDRGGVGGGNTAVYQFPFNFIAGADGNSGGTSGTKITIGQGGASRVFSGAFDNAYFTSVTPATPTGHLWVCGTAGANPTLYSIPIVANVVSASTAGPVLAGLQTPCSPITEFFDSNSSTDFIFVSTQNQAGTGVPTGCVTGEGCVQSYTVDDITGLATFSGAGAFLGGSSGMVVDTQDTTTAGTLQIYFGTLSDGATCAGNGAGQGATGSGGCAIQAPMAIP